MKRKFFLCAISFFVIAFGYGQTLFKVGTNPELKVSGTSSLHDWTMTSTKATGDMKATVSDEKLVELTSLTITMPAESIKSGKSGMDKNAYKAMKSDKHKEVKFVLQSAKKESDTQWALTGTFTLAGVSKNVTVRTSFNKQVLTGKHAFKLTDFSIEPPKALLGTITTGDDVTIEFKLPFVAK